MPDYGSSSSSGYNVDREDEYFPRGASLQGDPMNRTSPYVGVFVHELRSISLVGSLASGSASLALSALLTSVGFWWDLVQTPSENRSDSSWSLFFIIAAGILFLLFTIGALTFFSIRESHINRILEECPQYLDYESDLRSRRPSPRPYWFIRVWRWHLAKLRSSR